MFATTLIGKNILEKLEARPHWIIEQIDFDADKKIITVCAVQEETKEKSYFNREEVINLLNNLEAVFYFQSNQTKIIIVEIDDEVFLKTDEDKLKRDMNN